MVGISLLTIWFILAVFSYIKNQDLLSPVKFYILYVGVYFGAIFYKSYTEEIYLTYLALLVVGLFLVIAEPNMSRFRRATKLSGSFSSKYNIRRAINCIWILSIIPIISQIYLIQFMGGIINYINKLGLRVVEWQGMGFVIELIKMFSILNIVYFAFMLVYKSNKIDWVKYLAHLLIMVVLGLLSGSRGGLLGNFVLLVIVYNYLKKRVKLKLIIPLIIVLLILASLIGIARNGYKITDSGFITGLANNENIFELQHFEYGIIPLKYIYSIDLYEFQYGFTFLTPITNLIPRKIWPGKPDTGGIIFTKLYTGNAWGGYSNLAPGIIGEGVINFGKPLGIIFGLFVLFICILFTCKFYKILINKIGEKDSISFKTLIYLIFYCFIITSVPALVQAEWTKTILSIIYKGFKLLIIYLTINSFIEKTKTGMFTNTNKIIRKVHFKI